jgi:hypothetical protein
LTIPPKNLLDKQLCNVGEGKRMPQKEANYNKTQIMAKKYPKVKNKYWVHLLLYDLYLPILCTNI